MFLSNNVVYSDRYDRRAFEEIKAKSISLQALEQNGVKRVKTYPPLLMDLYSILYKADPWLKPENQTRPSERVNRMLVKKVMDTQQYAELREYTYLDEFASSMAVLVLGEAVLTLIPEDVQQKLNDMKSQEENELSPLDQQARQAGAAAQGAQEDANDAAMQATQAAAQAREAQAQNQPQAGQLQRQAQQMAQDARQAQAQADGLQAQARQAQITFEQAQERLAEQADELVEKFESQMGDRLRQEIRKAAKRALEETQETCELIEAWGVEPGEIQNLPYEEKLELAKKLKGNQKLKEVAELVGRFRRMALSKQKEKPKSRAGVVVNVTRGNDLRRLVPSERAQLAHPVMKMDFMRRYVGHQLFVYETEEKKTLGNGPVIVCIDNSGSIQPEQEIWEKGLALGLFQAAEYQNRHFVFIQYGGPKDPLCVVEIRPGEASYRKLIEIAQYFLGGGTDFIKPLSKAREFIEKGLKADVVFITDGHCAVSQEFLLSFNQARKDVPFSVFSVLLTRGGSVSTAAVEHFSNQVFTVEDLTCEQAGEVFAVV